MCVDINNYLKTNPHSQTHEGCIIHLLYLGIKWHPYDM
jgi:hypothetical protein